MNDPSNRYFVDREAGVVQTAEMHITNVKLNVYPNGVGKSTKINEAIMSKLKRRYTRGALARAATFVIG